MTKKKNLNILEGPIWTSIIYFAIPIAFSSLLQQLFNVADQAVVGQFAGTESLAAVGSNSPIISLLVNVFSASSIGANALIARKIGEGKKEEINRIVHTSITFAMVSGVCLMVIGQFAAQPLLVLVGCPDNVIDLAATYLKIYTFGFPFALVFNFGAAILRSTGDTRRPMIALIIAGIINVILNLIFVIGFQMNVAGVALATSASNVVSCTLVIYFLSKEKTELQLHLSRLGIHLPSLGQVLQIGGPAALQSAVFSVSNICIQSGINSLGSDCMAGNSAAANFDFISFFIISAFSQAATTFCGQNYGARQMDRCKKAIRTALIESLIFACVFDQLVVLFRVPIIRIFTSDPAVAEYAYTKLKIALTLHFTISLYEVMGASLRSIGYSMAPALLTIFGCVIFRLCWLATVFKSIPTFAALEWVYPASWFVTAFLICGFYLIKRKKIYSV